MSSTYSSDLVTNIFCLLCSFSIPLPPSSPSFPLFPVVPRPFFCFSPLSTRPWDPLNDLIQFEKDGCVQTKVRHRTPMVRSGSVLSLSNQGSRRDNCKCQQVG